MSASRRVSLGQSGLLALVLVTVLTPRATAQTVTVRTVADALHVQARNFSFIDGPVLARLKEGRSVRIDFEMAVLAKPEGPIVTRDAETWCLENVTMPVSSLGLGRDTPFWIRLAYRVQDAANAGNAEPGERYTLQGLIDRLSRRREEDNLAWSIDAGPFRLP